MSTPDKLKLILERWKASLRNRNRSAQFVVSNFDDLFNEMSSAGATFEEAHELLPAAIKAHQPDPGLIRQTWKLNKQSKRNFVLSEKEFGEKWCNGIADDATNSFNAFFPMPTVEEKKYGDGKIANKEYKLMRQHAAQFTPVDFEKLAKINDDLLTDEVEILKQLKERLKK